MPVWFSFISHPSIPLHGFITVIPIAFPISLSRHRRMVQDSLSHAITRERLVMTRELLVMTRELWALTRELSFLGMIEHIVTGPYSWTWENGNSQRERQHEKRVCKPRKERYDTARVNRTRIELARIVISLRVTENV